ncbi:hypothetical protein [Agromyces silvae]|uniref:hypothetical protein n=1 Tax=Agromyces silvae TaxID=3388266 RepID=UPI00280AED33|nr:hypothetical protein [Agromyces protaetiae]
MSSTLRRAGLTMLVSLALVVGIGVPTAGAAEAPADQAEAPADQTEAAAAASADSGPGFPADSGITVPSGKNEHAVDILGLGYEQIVRLNGSRVEIVEPVTRGSHVLRSFEAGASAAWPKTEVGAPLFYGGSNMTTLLVGHSASRLAVTKSHIYVTTMRSEQVPDSIGRPRLVAAGTVTTMFTVDGEVKNWRTEGREFAVTALDAFEWKGEEYLAIGLNYSGVRIVKPGQWGMPDFRVFMTHYSGPDREELFMTHHRDQITEVELGTDGENLLVVVGVLTFSMPTLLGYDVTNDREIWAKNFRSSTDAWQWPEVVSIGTSGLRGQPQAVVGWPTLGNVNIIDLATGDTWKSWDGGVLASARYFTSVSGEPRVALRRGIGHVFESFVLKVGADGELAATASGGGAELAWMAPGYRAMSVQIDNRTGVGLRFQLFTGASDEQGCWMNSGMQGVTSPFPSQPVQVAAGASSAQYVAAHILWGEPGNACRLARAGAFSMQLDPLGEPGHRQVAQVITDGHGLWVHDQVGGGRFSVRTEPNGPRGVRLVVTDRHAAPSIVGAPVIEAARLTPAPAEGHQPGDDVNDPTRPVHRFTVSGVTWRVQGSDADLADATLPLPRAQASVDGERWDDLGTIASPLAPSREGDRVTMGAAVFDWQTAVGAANDYRYFRVAAGGAISQVVDVTTLAAPTPTSIVTKVDMSGTGTPRGNGLDQIAMRVSLHGGAALDPTDYPELYARVYYRDLETKALITGLGDPTVPNQAIMFSLQPGQYPNDGLSAQASSIGAFFSIRSPEAGRQIIAVFKSDGTKKSAHGSPAGQWVSPAKHALTTQGTGAGGLSVGSCAEGACVLADPGAAPALHSLTATSVSVQLRTGAVPGSGSLPMLRPEGGALIQPLPSDTVLIGAGRATLSNPNAFGPVSTITSHVVTHGERITFENRSIR